MHSRMHSATTSLVEHLAPYEAYNLYLNFSVILLDCCASHDDEAAEAKEHQADDDGSGGGLPSACADGGGAGGSPVLGIMQGSAWLNPRVPLKEAAAAARAFVVEELTPDDATTALVLHDDASRAEAVAAWLRTEGGCRRVLACERAALRPRHAFLLRPDALSLRLPSEIVAGRIFLGSAGTANGQAMQLLGITAVVSLLDRSPPRYDGVRRHLHVRIADGCHADLDSALEQALPFAREALSEADGRLLVHCEAGASRSASVVLALLMAAPVLLGRERLGLDEALAIVRRQRPCVRPNDGFMEALRRRAA